MTIWVLTLWFNPDEAHELQQWFFTTKAAALDYAETHLQTQPPGWQPNGAALHTPEARGNLWLREEEVDET